MEAAVAASQRRDSDSREAAEQRADVCGPEHVQMREIPFRLQAADETKPVLHPERVRHGADENATRAKDATHLCNERAREADVLEELAGDDHVEGLAVQRQRLVDVRDDGRDPELLRLRQRGPVDVDADHLVPLQEMAGQRARAASEVEHVSALPDRLLEERNSLGDEHEVAGISALAVVGLVQLAEERAHAS